MTPIDALPSKGEAYNPGSDEAHALGCTCPRMDNSYGKGWLGSGQFWITEGCPMHAGSALSLARGETSNGT